MMAFHPTALLSFSFTLILLVASSAMGQFKETYEPSGYILEWNVNTPHGIATDASGYVYVVEVADNRIEYFSSVGQYQNDWGSSGSGPGHFNQPHGIAADSSGNVYVADTGNNRIQKFDSAGNQPTDWGSYGNGAGQFDSPNSVAADGLGYVFVADTGNNRIQKFDSAGTYIMDWGSSGSGPGQFNLPWGVVADALGNVYVADTFNHRIQKFNSFGLYLTEWGGSGIGEGFFDHPYGVTVDTLGNVFVADTGNNRIQKFDSTGLYLTEWGSYGSGNGQFYSPSSVAADTSGNVYVADSGNSRIQRFVPVLRFDLAGYESYLSVSALNETTAVRTLFRLENNGAPRFALKNWTSGNEWSFQQSGPGNFLISKEGTGGPEMQVYQTGMVRMGPGGANRFTLYPNGNLVIAGSLTANGSKFPDYVFDPDYDLMPLSDLRQHIAEKRRLPNLPSAEEVKQQGGHNMTELQLKLLEKIEELTLYTLEQQEMLQEQGEELLRKNAELASQGAKIRHLEARLASIEALMRSPE